MGNVILDKRYVEEICTNKIHAPSSSHKKGQVTLPLGELSSPLVFSSRNTCTCAGDHTRRMVPAILFVVITLTAT